MSNILVELENATKNYISISFNLKILKNKKYLIVGPNGSGKTTLLKLLAKYIKPDQGKIKFYTNNIIYLPDKINLPNNINVKEYIEIIENIKNNRVDYYLFHHFDIPLTKKISELSKGNIQKLILLTSLINNYDLYLLDEPLNGLDQNSIKTLNNYILNSNNKTFLIVSHYSNYFEYVDEVINLWIKLLLVICFQKRIK